MANQWGGGNIVRRAFTPPNITEFPAMFWHPETAEAKVFNKAAEVPEGWLPHHPNDKRDTPAQKAPEQPKLSLTRSDILRELQSAGISHNVKGSTQSLHELLRERATKHLMDAGVEFDAAADTKELLELCQKPE